MIQSAGNKSAQSGRVKGRGQSAWAGVSIYREAANNAPFIQRSCKRPMEKLDDRPVDSYSGAYAPSWGGGVVFGFGNTQFGGTNLYIDSYDFNDGHIANKKIVSSSGSNYVAGVAGIYNDDPCLLIMGGYLSPINRGEVRIYNKNMGTEKTFTLSNASDISSILTGQQWGIFWDEGTQTVFTSLTSEAINGKFLKFNTNGSGESYIDQNTEYLELTGIDPLHKKIYYTAQPDGAGGDEIPYSCDYNGSNKQELEITFFDGIGFGYSKNSYKSGRSLFSGKYLPSATGVSKRMAFFNPQTGQVNFAAHPFAEGFFYSITLPDIGEYL